MISRRTILFLTGLAALLDTTAGFLPSISLDASRSDKPVYSSTQPVDSPTKRGASAELLDLINQQVTNELSASQLYLSASLWCESKELSGMALYMRSEAAEERDHAMGFMDYALKRDFPIELEELEMPDSGWENVQELWEALLQAEEENTQNLLKLADAATACGDHTTAAFLMPYHMVRSSA